MKKLLKWTIRSVLSVVILFLVTVLVLCCVRVPMYRTFLNRAETEVLIPGLDAPYCPQGLAYVAKDQTYLFTGYMTDKTASRIYVVNAEEKVGMVTLENIDGTPFLGHAGGIAVHNDSIYIATDQQVYMLPYQEIVQKAYEETTVSIVMDCSFPVHNEASFVFANEEGLWVGEFYLKGKYETDVSHETTTKDGSISHAWIECFPFAKEDGTDEDTALPYHLHSLLPSHILTIREKVQGFAMDDAGCYYLSCSYSIKHSYLYRYRALEDTEKTAPDRTTIISEKNIPVFDLDSTRLLEKTRVMPMSEDLDYADGKIYINFESACKKYRLFNIYPTKHVMSYKIDEDLA